LTAPLATSLGTAAATKAGVGALTSVAMDLLKGQKPSWKKALAGAAIGGAVGAGMYGLQNASDAAQAAVDKPSAELLPSPEPQPSVPPAAIPTPTGTGGSTQQLASDIIKHWKAATNTQFGQMGLGGDPSTASSADNAMLNKIIGYIKQNNVNWDQLSNAKKDLLVSNLTGKYGRG
jgi:hypothetical protein